MASEAYLKMLEEEATFPSVAAGGRPWRIFVPPTGTAIAEPQPIETKKGKRVSAKTHHPKSDVSKSKQS